ncbi:MAG: tRNA dihydrouridine(20/20a) synthase DusA [Pseudomonadota bacterium]
MDAAAPISRRFAVAPMLDWTDRHCRYFLRLISRHALLYTEMVTTGAILHGDRAQHLNYNTFEHPLALQLGGSDPRELAECSAIASDYGYDEINLNVGCPSDRVQDGRFGACLMREPERVGECIGAMRAKTPLPVTVKTRLGVDEHDSYEFLCRFIEIVSAAGCRTFILHARKAWLHGLSPKENREIPPLLYERVYHIKRDFPELEIIINGGITRLDQALDHLRHVDGVMVGREAYHNPYLLADVDRLFFGDDHPIPSRAEIIQSFLPYIEAQLRGGWRLHHLTRHILGLYQGVPGARPWRRHLSERAHRPDAGVEVITSALPAQVEEVFAKENARTSSANG